MKKRITLTIAAITAVVFMTGCGPSYKGTDSTVKKTAIDCCKEILCDQLAPSIYQKVTGVPVGLYGVQIKYEDLVKSNKPKDQEVVRAIDKTMEKIKFSLRNIRTNSIDKEAKMSTNEADLVLFNPDNKNDPEKKIPIMYTAQLNDEGNVYVSVRFLK